MTTIVDLKGYNERMKKSLIDKIFFIDKVDTDVIIDFGCANGTLIGFLNSIFPEYQYVGYDNDFEMINSVDSKLATEYKNCTFTADFIRVENLVKEYKKANKKITILLSSVIHEVYSYGFKNVNEFWQSIFKLNVDYIVIRDMCVSKTASHPADIISVNRVRQIFDKNKISEHEQYWGSLEENWSLTHFLLKYKFEKNWDREVRENYFPINKEDLLILIPQNYFPDFVEHYTLPFVRNQVRKDF